MIANGFSVRGLSDVITDISAVREDISPMRGRFPLSLSPPHPNTDISRPDVSSRTDSRIRSSASGCVSVVDDYGEILSFVDYLVSSADRLDVFESAGGQCPS